MPIEQLVDVEIGDLILLTGEDTFHNYFHKKYEVSGFVAGIKNGTRRSYVKLSHDNPKGDKDNAAVARRLFAAEFPGNRWYRLKKFDSYEILKFGAKKKNS